MTLEYASIVSGAPNVSGVPSVSLYLLQFDRKGTLTSPATRAALIDAVKSQRYRDVYVFAHGWNNDFDDSQKLFREFFQGFLNARPATPGWKPVFVGIQWPSIVIVFPWEKGPKLAGADADNGFQKQAVGEIGDELTQAQSQRFAELAGRKTLNHTEQQEMSALARAALQTESISELGDNPPSEAELLAAWRALDNCGVENANGEFGFATDRATGPQAAGLGFLDPRNLIRTATVYTMKDRAGIIGSVAVRPLVEELTATGAQVRVIGHSYGARVMLAALATASLPRKVRSALLLQPAVNQFCFADAGQIPRSAHAGGFRKALDQLSLPLYTTFSAKDFPLHDTFHLALRRSKDLGEAEIAAGAPPSVYCALGGYGPRGLATGATASVQIQDAGAYVFAPANRIVALDGTQGHINGHGDVTNRYACWALAEQDQRAI